MTNLEIALLITGQGMLPLSNGTYTRPSVPVVTVSTRPPSLTRRISKVVLGIRWVLSAAFTFTSSNPPMGAL